MERVSLRDGDAATLAGAQSLRLNRVLRGTVAFACTAAIVIASWVWGFLDGVRALHYLLAVAAINVAAIAMILSGANLRLRDPSMTVPLIITSLFPSLYVMYHLGEPTVRGAFLLMGSVAVLFGALALDRRRMLALSGFTLVTYAALLVALHHTAPERVDLRSESMLVFAYCIVLMQTATLGSFIGGLRTKLREKNASLVEAMADLEELATRDPLTRLPNRRTAMTQLERELSRAERRRQSEEGLCIALLDVDHFKRVNDRYGHQAGDAVLREIGATLDRVMREGDFVARFGGEEFLIILPETSLQGGLDACERVRSAVAAIAIDGLPLREPTTVSIGIAAHESGQRIEETLTYADRALYRAKHHGRNRVEPWLEPPAERLGT